MSHECEKRLREEASQFTEEDIAAVRFWMKEMRTFGPEYIEKSKNYRDHLLTRGQWAGHRASCISLAGRIIYKVVNDEIIIVEIKRITLDHDYR